LTPASGGDSASGVVKGEIDPDAAGFELPIENGSGPDGTMAGPFMLRGANIRYDDSLSVLLVDLSVVNQSRTAYPEPIGLTFVSLFPEGVTVLNPDNGISGPGASIVFEFANDDGMWTPGEESFPRTVEFGVGRGISIGFVARLDIGMAPSGGAIGGIVWLDTNENGVMDADEHGQGGVEVFLSGGVLEITTIAEIMRRAVTAADGSYRFDGLRAGFYKVFKRADSPWRPTTPSVIHVVLTEVDGTVGDFLMANFGCIFQLPVPTIHIGDFIRASGEYVPGDGMSIIAGLLIARDITIFRCGDRGCVRPGILNGPVTAVNRPERALRVMSEWVSFAARDSMPGDGTVLDPDSVEVGDRVSAGVHDNPNGVDDLLKGFSLSEWGESFEQAGGYVKRIGGGPNQPPAEIVVLRRTRIMVTPETTITIFNPDH
ncbi:MAG: SdrD B-like domain-containing protein, partial [Candidatus Krumholzibacteria bacterium]